MNESEIQTLSGMLAEAAKNAKPVGPLTEKFPDMTIADAYAVQMTVVKDRLAKGGAIVGKKVGLTSRAMQEMLGVSTPDFGHLLADMLFAEDVPVPVSAFLQPKIEAELAFILAEDILGPGVTLVDILRATLAVVPAFEIIDSRIADWKIRIQDTIADNGSSGGFVVGSKLVPVDAVNLKYAGLVLEKNGVVVDTAAGAAVLGHPAQSVAWLANTLGAMGIPLKKGEIVLSGSFTKAYPVAGGDVFTATFGGLGSVSASFGA
ncbi:MAG: fumarylacetoacetate hydrolase family protein [Desulfovibrio sp.]|jgi:2-oxopent-4-enoate hydratase|nr:fumarylacetoacetate hydrolase family protein [Desulfovibrio sp.]